jgi:hypothetical protein
MAEMARVTSQKIVFLDALWTGTWGIPRLLWRFDRGFYPRRTAVLLDALREHFELERVERYRVLHNYLLCLGSPRRSTWFQLPFDSGAIHSVPST